MAARNPTPDVTEEEVMALFEGKDGQDSEEPQEPEEEPEAKEDEESEQEDESDESEEDEEEEPEGDEDSEIDWGKVEPRIKAAYDKIQSEAQKWQKDYGKIQSQWTKASQAQKEFESTRAVLEQRNELLTRLEEMLENNPKLVEMIQKENARTQNPFGADDDVPDYLKEDPAYQYLEQRYKPLITSLKNELDQVKQKTSRFDEMDKQKAEAENRQKLDAQLSAAGEQIKSIFGRDAKEEEITEVLQYMVDNKFYGNGKAAALAVYGDKYEQGIIAKHQAQMKEKAKKFPSRNKSVSSARAQISNDALTPQEALARALADQGY